MKMIDLMMNNEQDVIALLERLTGGPLEDFECAEDAAADAFFAMAGAGQSVEIAHRASR